MIGLFLVGGSLGFALDNLPDHEGRDGNAEDEQRCTYEPAETTCGEQQREFNNDHVQPDQRDDDRSEKLDTLEHVLPLLGSAFVDECSDHQARHLFQPGTFGHVRVDGRGVRELNDAAVIVDLIQRTIGSALHDRYGVTETPEFGRAHVARVLSGIAM